MGTRKRRTRSRKTNYGPIILVAAICFALVLAGGFAFVLVIRQRGNGDRDNRPGAPASTSELAAAVADTDKLDPNWRLADIARTRARLDPEKNCVRLALSARQVPDTAFNVLDGRESRRDPSRPPPASEVDRIRSVVQSYGQALSEARGMAGYSAGQFDINFNFDRPLDTKLEAEQMGRKTAALLLCDAEVRAAAGDGPGAVRSAIAILVLARCYQDEPFLISHLLKIAINAIAIDALEQALTCASVSDDELVLLQWLLETGGAETLLSALRGERATIHAAIEKNTVGTVSTASHAWFLRTMNRTIDLTSKGAAYSSPEWTSFLADVRGGLPTDLRVMPALDKISAAGSRGTAILRTTAVAVAAERYRRAVGAWPTDLRQLVPNYISALPTDPYTGNAIQSAQTPQGFSVYVQGQAATASGEFSAIGTQPEKCQGFRLLNPERRLTAPGK
jgi:hypothetical protein